ncbi:peptide deformylase [Alkalihalobacillus trypoxylicola]|uniref:Peptide deformylase n=1 Tax=Alkalihalobacillus trypoxylicola TaxID=519424 RepID=A0A162FBS5_9BACI|nr:peptide deformylase [Alkalihalobacillus trypoxylicola]KYG35235.1 peptide deformylase [Alkalihalobacillus trypoxylicola]GAF63908.1 peptide deformylase [Bacillus sp. TS-2]
MITMKDIVREGDPVLRKIAEKVSLPLSKEDQQTLEEMLQFLKNSQDPELAEKYQLRAGVGIAAPQIGISKRMFAIHATDEKEQLYSMGLVNPKIISHSVEENHLEGGEGCLSVDREVPGIVPRHSRITLTATTLEGETVTLKLRGYIAIVVQHELDHLDGIMFYDRIEEFQDKLKIEKKL